MSSGLEGSLEHWRGFDPECRERGYTGYTNFLVRAPCEAVVRALREDREIPKRSGDLLASDGGVIGTVRDEGVYVFQLRGHDWTQVEPWGMVVLGLETAEGLSRRLNTQAFLNIWPDTQCGMPYDLFERGVLVESFSVLHDNPMYQGAEGEADLRQKLTEGWQISHDHTYEFLSRRGTKLDVESLDDCSAILERAVVSLGMFIACQPFDYNSTLGRVELTQKWKREHFAAAKLLYRTDADSPPQGERNHEKLIFDPAFRWPF